MAENTKQPVQKGNTEAKKAESSAAGISRPATARAKGSASAVVDIVFNVILVGSISFIGYMVYEQNKAVGVLFDQQNSFNGLRNEANENFGRMQSRILSLENDLASARQESESLRSEQAEEIERLGNELISTRLRLSNNPSENQEWLLAEAVSLLRLAQQQLVIAHSIRTAQALFIAADDVLKQIDDPAIFSVREILAGELATIRTVAEVDKQEIYLQLGALAEQVSRLQVNNDLAIQIASGETVALFSETENAEDGFFGKMIQSLKNTMDDYLVIRRRDVPIQALMTPGQEAALLQTIRLQLEQGRTALLKEEQEIYSNSLETARNLVAEYLAGDPAVKDSLLAGLDGLKSRRIITEAPPLTRTRAALEEILSASLSSQGNFFQGNASEQ